MIDKKDILPLPKDLEDDEFPPIFPRFTAALEAQEDASDVANCPGGSTSIINAAGNTGFVRFHNEDCSVDKNNTTLYPKDDRVLHKYLYYAVKAHENEWYKSRQKSLSKDTIRKVKIPIPGKEEQEEIIKALDDLTCEQAKLTRELNNVQSEFNRKLALLQGAIGT